MCGGVGENTIMAILRFRLPALLPVCMAGALFAGHEGRNPQWSEVRGNAQQRPVPAKAAEEFRKSQEALRNGNLDQALHHLRRVVAFDRGNMDAYNELGVLYYSSNQPDKAIEAFSTMIAIDPRSYRAHVNLAFALNAQQRYREAEQVARRGVALRKMDLKMRYLLGMALASQRKNLDEAADNLSMAAEEYPEARLELSRMLVEKGDFERAMRELQRFTEDRRFGEKYGVAPVQLFAK